MANPVIANTVSMLGQVYKKTNTPMLEALQTVTPEMSWLRETKKEKLIPSGLEMRLILDVLWQGGGSMIPDGGKEAGTGTAPPMYGTVAFNQYNNRFVITGLGMLFDRYGNAGQVIRQNVYQAKKAVEAMGRKIGMQTYGYTDGTVALVDGTPTGTTGVVIPLRSVYGSTLIGATNATMTATQKTYAAQLFRGKTTQTAGEWIAVLRAGVLVSNAIGNVVSRSEANGTITVDFGGSVTLADGDAIVFCDTTDVSTVADTEYGLWPVGLLQATQAASVHGLSTSQAENWRSFTDSSGGRYGFVKQRRGELFINNFGGTKPDTLIMANGVQTDATAAQEAARIYYNTSQFDLDGNLRKSGVTIKTSLLAPPGMCFLYDSDHYTKGDLGTLPGDKGSPDLFDIDKLPNVDQYAAYLNYAYFRAVTNRAAIACFSGLNEQ